MTKTLIGKLEVRALLAASEDNKRRDDFNAGLAAGLREAIIEIKESRSEILINEELLALRWKDWNQTIFLDRQYYRAHTYRHILDNLAMEVGFHGDERTVAIVESARKLMGTVEADAITYADKKYKYEGRVKPTEASRLAVLLHRLKSVLFNVNRGMLDHSALAGVQLYLQDLITEIEGGAL